MGHPNVSRFVRFLAFSVFVLTAFGAYAQSENTLNPEQMNALSWPAEAQTADESDRQFMTAFQILLNRAGFSVGVIDGLYGENMEKALASFQRARNLEPTGKADKVVWETLRSEDSSDLMQLYTITEEDLEGPFAEELPTDYAELAERDSIPYTSPEEMLAERFWMDIDFLREINPNADFSSAGTQIVVAVIAQDDAIENIASIVVDVQTGALHALSQDGSLVAHFPATIGSAQTPSPSGTHEIVAVAEDPTYTYKPDENFKQGDNDKVLTLPPGPNGPVGNIWIDLSKETFGIHGTPDPALIDKSYSHGCVRLTNWDAKRLAHSVKAGMKVTFQE